MPKNILSRPSTRKRYVLVIVTCLFVLICSNVKISRTDENIIQVKLKISHDKLQTYFESREAWNTSNLGAVLFKNQKPPDTIQEDRTYRILIWRYWKWLQNRHVYNYNQRQYYRNPLNNCSVKNCKFYNKDDDIRIADAVVIHIQHGLLPNATLRNSKQRWIFLSDESPRNAFSMAKTRPKIRDLAGFFNWSMTYRSDSDVPVPYGRTIPSRTPLDIKADLSQSVPFWKKKRRDILVSILISNCKDSRRMKYLKELQNYVTVDVFGACSKDHKDSCPGHFKSDCEVITEYVFYLVFENSECHEYLTEKGFYNAYGKGAIPIVMGPSVKDCKMLLPPKSYLHVDDYKSAADLANHIMDIAKNDWKILKYHEWRRSFEVINEHGYFKSASVHYCRVCEALNYNDKSEKVYDEKMLRSFLDPSINCV